MSYQTMTGQVRGAVPKVPLLAAQAFVNKGWKDVRESGLWSWQLFEAGWITPPQIQTGLATVVQGTKTVVVNAAAAAAIDAASTLYSLITARQFRVAAGTIYNIWGWDSPSRTLTLDRMYGEPSATGTGYSIYQVYYPAPMQDFLKFVSVRNMSNFIDLNLDKTRELLDAIDPQRTWYYFPTDVVPYQLDQNPASPTYGYPLFELWGAPTYTLTYQLYGIRRGSDLVAPGDTLPFSIGEDCVIERAKRYAYEWAEANKGENPRNVGPDFKFLMGKADAEYERLMKKYRMRDREYANQWFAIRRSALTGKLIPYYSTLSGTANPGAF